jgi:hypothetical protein
MAIAVVEQTQETTHQEVAGQSRRISIVMVLTCALGVVAATIIYQPWAPTPFDIIDFSEFLPFLYENNSIHERFGAFVSYFVGQGRFDLLSYLLIIWKWSFFGSNVIGWQVARFIEMCGVVAAVYLLLRRLGSERWGSVFGASLFIVAQAATPAWIRLTMGEPFGLLAIIGASLIATRYQETARWRSAAVAIALLMTATLLAKEMLAAFVPFVLVLACTSGAEGEWLPFRLTKRNAWLAVMLGVGTLAVLVPVAVVALRASAGAYVSDYGTGVPSFDRLLYAFTVILLPVSGWFEPHVPFTRLAAGLIFSTIAATGLLLAHGAPALRRKWTPLSVGALLLVVVGAVIYLPWPYFQNFYGLPFLLGPALLLALAITATEKRLPRWRWIVYAGGLAIFCQGATAATHESRAAIAARRINGALAKDFARYPTADSIVVAMRYLTAQSWQGRGATLGRYARAVSPGQSIPRVSDALCTATLPMLRNGVGNAVLITYSDQCGQFPVQARSIRYYYTYLEWPTMTSSRDSLVVGILGPISPE